MNSTPITPTATAVPSFWAKELAAKVKAALEKDLKQQESYYAHIRNNQPAYFGGFERTEAPINERLQIVLKEIEAKYATAPASGN